MPEHFYSGPNPGVYPMTRDASGLLLGAVEPGDVRDLDEAPDPSWLPREGNEELLAGLLAPREAAELAGDGPEEASGSEDKGPAVDTAARLPRRKRPASEDTGTQTVTTTAGDTGSEES